MRNFESLESNNNSSDKILRDAAILYEENKMPLGITPEQAEILIQEIDEKINEYSNNNISIDEILKRIDSLKNNKDDDLQAILSFIKERALEVKESNHRYKNLVQRMEDLDKIDKFRMDTQDFQSKQQKYDESRKICHDNIISNLLIIKRYATEVLPDKFKIDLGPELVFPFSEEEARNEKRDCIGDWSRDNATKEELELYREKLKEITEQ